MIYLVIYADFIYAIVLILPVHLNSVWSSTPLSSLETYDGGFIFEWYDYWLIAFFIVRCCYRSHFLWFEHMHLKNVLIIYLLPFFYLRCATNSSTNSLVYMCFACSSLKVLLAWQSCAQIKHSTTQVYEFILFYLYLLLWLSWANFSTHCL
jgi:biotin transporter BioY